MKYYLLPLLLLALQVRAQDTPAYDFMLRLDKTASKSMENHRYLVRKNGKYGLYCFGMETVACRYDTVYYVYPQTANNYDIALVVLKSGDTLELSNDAGDFGGRRLLGPCRSIKAVNEQICACEDYSGLYSFWALDCTELADTFRRGGVEAWRNVDDEITLFKKYGRWRLWYMGENSVSELSFEEIIHVPAKYDKLFIVKNGGYSGFYSAYEGYYIPTLFDSVRFLPLTSPNIYHLVAVQVNGRWGIVDLYSSDALGQLLYPQSWLLPPLYTDIRVSKDKILLEFGEQSLTLAYSSLYDMSFPFPAKGPAASGKGDLGGQPQGIYEEKGKYGFSEAFIVLTGPVWDSLEMLPEGILLGRLNGKYGAMTGSWSGENPLASMLLPPVFDNYRFTAPGILEMQCPEGKAYLFRSGGMENPWMAVPFVSDSLTMLGHNWALLWKNGRFRTVKEIISSESFLEARLNAYDEVEVRNEKGWGIIGTTEEVVPALYDSVYSFREGRKTVHFVKKNGFWKYYTGSYAYDNRRATYVDSLLIPWKNYLEFRKHRTVAHLGYFPAYLQGLGADYFWASVQPSVIYYPDAEAALMGHTDWMSRIFLPERLAHFVSGSKGEFRYVSEDGDTILMHRVYDDWLAYRKLDTACNIYGLEHEKNFYFSPEPGKYYSWTLLSSDGYSLKADTLGGKPQLRIKTGNLQGLYYDGQLAPPVYLQVVPVRFRVKGYEEIHTRLMVQETSGKWHWLHDTVSYSSPEKLLKAYRKKMGKRLEILSM